MLTVILLLGAACALGGWLWKNYTHFSRRGVNHAPAAPLVGDMGGVLMQREHLMTVLERSYNSCPGDNFIGRYEFMTPFVIIKELELLKKVTIKDFEYFVDRKSLADPKTDPLLGRILLSLKGDEWKDMRSTLSPAFTSSKIRLMMPFMVKIGSLMMQSVRDKLQKSEANYIDLEATDLTTRYANDVIASCAFGIDINSQFEGNFLYNQNKEIFTINFIMKLKFIAFKMVPWLMSFLRISVFSKRVRDFYSDVVLGAMKQRQEMHIHRPDMIHLLMEAKKGHLSHDAKSAKDDDAGFATVEESEVGRTKNKRVWSDNDLVAQAVTFLFAGYETISTTMRFLLYEMAVNPECQERLLEEIKENEEKNQGKFDYNSIQHMTYLDMIVSEVLRKWPGVPLVDRVCVRDYNLRKPNSKATKDVILRKGDMVQIPVWAYHHDPRHFPDPKKFDPERFSETNKHNINPLAYMPFGLGPRNCIGSRFALCEVKVMAYQLLRSIEVSPCEKTMIPLQLSKENGFRLTVEGGTWVRFKVRD